MNAAVDAVAAVPRSRRWRWVPAAGEALLVLLMAAVLGAAAIGGRGSFDGFVARFHLFAFIAAGSFAVLAVVLGRRHPANRVGAIALGIAWGFGLAMVLERYATVGYPRAWPGVTWVLWASQWTWQPAILAIPTLLALRFPDGDLLSPRWRHLERLTVAAVAAATVGFALTPYGVLDAHPPLALSNPVATTWGLPLFRGAATVVVVAVVAALVGLGLRLVRSREAERAQLTWALLGTFGTIAVTGLSLAIGPEAAALSSVGIALLPAGIIVAVLRHGLWDVDVVLNRSLVYALLTVTILAVYVAVVGLLGGVLGRTVGAPLVATVVVAVVAAPARDQLQRVANRLLYGDREDPYRAVSRLAAHLDAAVDRPALLAGVTDAVVRALRLRGAMLVVDGAVVASVGEVGSAPRVLPLSVRGQHVGELRVAPRSGDDLRPADRQLLTDLTRHVAAAVRAEQLQADLERSRVRLVTAREEERRRIRRDLHDELGPTLASIGLDIERASLDVDQDPDAAAARLEHAATRIRDSVRSVRGLVEGLRPAALDELGLVGAVRELARPYGATVESSGDLDDLPAAVDVAAYRIVAEAIANVARHAAASECHVALSRAGDRLVVIVEDDGRGVSSDDRLGVGRRSMAERAAELGGQLTIASRAGGGTRVEAVLPVAPA